MKNAPFSPPRITSTAVEVRIRALVSKELSMYLRTFLDDAESRIASLSDDGIFFECKAVHFRYSIVGFRSVKRDLNGFASMAWIACARYPT